MDLYGGSFKIHDMIDSDMRTELDEYMSDIPRTPGSPMLSTDIPEEVDMGNRTLDSEFSEDGIGWMNNSTVYNISSDLDSISGLLVNPETALPVSVTQLSTMATISMSQALSGTVNVTLTPSKMANSVVTSDCQTVTLPLQVITTTATLMSELDNKQSHVNLTVAVPTSGNEPGSNQVHQLLSMHRLSEADDNETKTKSKTKHSKIPSGHVENSYPKPAYSYSCLIAMALKNSKTGSLPVNEIYDFMTENFPYFKTAPNGWKNSVRHNLSLNKCFEKIEKPVGNGTQRKGYLWALNPAKVEKMEEELQKWGSRDPAAIRKSMANPERLELIEKGELKNTDSMDTKPIDIPNPPSVKFENEHMSDNELDVKAPVDCLNSELTSSDFSPLDAPVGMDSIPDLELQKGIWDNLCDGRLQFMDSPINSPSPKHMGMSSNLGLDEDSIDYILPSDMPKSFVRANYIYSCAVDNSNSSDDESPKRHSDVGAADKNMICDA